MSSNTNIGNTPVNQGYVQLIHTGETGGIDGTLRTLYDGDGTASDLQIASNKVKVSTELYIGSKTATEFIQDIVGSMFTTGSYTNITTTYDDTNGNIDLSASGEVTLTGTQTLTNKTLASPTFTGTANGVNLTLSGDLTVNGTTTTLDTTNLKVTDNLIELNQGVASNANDSGIIIERGSTGDNAIIMWDESADKFTLGTTTATADATGNIIITTGTLVASTFEGNLTGNVTGSASLNLLISNNLSDLANAATARTNLGVDAAGTDNSTDVTLAGTLDYITIAGQTITRNAIDLTTDVTGTLPVGNGGTGLTSISTLLNSNVTPSSLGLVIGTDVLAQQTIGIANDNLVEIDDLDAADNDYAKFTANGLEGRSYAEVRSDLSLGTLALQSTIDFDDINGTAYITSAEAFSDSDLQLMTAAAIDDLIVSKGYGTGNGDITAVTAGVGIGGGGLSGDVDLTFEGSELPDMTDLMVSTDEFVVLDGTTSKRKAISEIRLTAFDDTGFSSGISFNGSTANGLLTYGSSTTADVESNLTFDGTNLAIAGAGKLYFGGGSHTYISEDVDDRLRFFTGGAEFMRFTDGGTTSNLGLYTDNTQRLHITKTGNVGIGTTSPNRLLHLQSTGDAIMQITSADGSGAYIDLGDVSDVDGGRIVYDSGSNLLFNTASTEKLRITSGGNVGIGTTSPSAKLEVNGDLEISPAEPTITLNRGNGSYSWKIVNGAGTGSYPLSTFNIANNAGTPVITALDSGNVGIGTQSPSYKLDVYGVGRIYSPSGDADLRMESGYATNTTSFMIRNGAGNNRVDFLTGGANAMTINSSQNVGIGTTSPSGKLDVEDTTGSLSSTKDITAEFMRADGTYYPRLQVRHSTSGTNIYHTYSTGASLLTFGNGGTADAMAIDSSGNVGIGTSSLDAGAKLNVVSGSSAYTAQFSRHNADDGLFLHSEAQSTHYNWLITTQDNVDKGFEITPSTAVGNRSFTTPAFVIKADTGNVGIGTNSPVQKLHVVGNGYFTADVVAYYSSDKRLKDNIKNIDNAIDKIQQLNGVEFDWNNKQDVYTGHDIGVIAQEIEEVLPEVVTTREDGYKAVKYEKIVPLLIEAIKEQQQQINELKEKLNG